MIHHFARALAVRENLASPAPVQQSLFWPSLPCRAEVAARAGARPLRADTRPTTSARVSRDPNDGRRALISGRFADVCAALDRMATEFETA
jgi:hypothetical protein